MTLLTTFISLALSLPLLTRAAVTQNDITGYGEIWVLEADDWRTGNPSQKVGCLSNSGRFISSSTKDDKNKDKSKVVQDSELSCGVFSKLTDYPYTFSSRAGNCTFNNEKTETNKDSVYGKRDHAWSCNGWYESDVYDGLYTIDGFNYPFLCWGDIACFYDVPKFPKENDKDPLWQFRWGAQQRGITPGHKQVMLMFHKVGEAPKREAMASIPGPRVEIKGGIQAPLRGPELRA